MVQDIGRNIRVDIRYESNQNFFNDDWGERIFALVKDAPQLEQLILDLMIGWRAAAYTASLPATVIAHVKAFHDAFVNTSEINTTLLRLCDAVLPKLALKVSDLSSDPRLVRDLRVAIIEIATEVETARKNNRVDFPLEDTWKDYLEDPVYQLSLWGSQQICYVAIYNAYDNFLAHAVRIARSLDKCRTSDKDFKEQFVRSLGRPLLDKCWTNAELNIARLVRHALSHAGGRVTSKLAKQKHGFTVYDNRIQVMPDNTKALYKLLEDCVYALCEKAATLSEFGHSSVSH